MLSIYNHAKSNLKHGLSMNVGSCVKGNFYFLKNLDVKTIFLFGVLGYRIVRWGITRGTQGLLPAPVLPIQNHTRQEAKAASKIQKTWRQYKRIHLLRASEEAAGAWFEHIIHHNAEGIPTAENGKTPVFFPEGLPIVIKRCWGGDASARIDKMKQARKLCEKIHSQHLVIPQARICKFEGRALLLESKMPIMHRTKEQIGLYIENRDRFTDVIKEFAYFHCQSDWQCLRSRASIKFDPYEALARTPLGRYDNLALYLENGIGKLAFVDSERFHPLPKQIALRFYAEKCIDLICLFPLHFEEIMKIVFEFDPKLKKEHYLLYVREGLKRFDLAYNQHAQFVQAKGINLDTPTVLTALGRLAPERREVLALSLKTELCLRYGSDWVGAHEDKLETEIFPQILDAISVFISRSIAAKHQPQHVSSRVELLSLRTLEFKADNRLYAQCIDQIKSVLSPLGSEEKEIIQHRVAEIVFDTLLSNMQGKEIAYYNPTFGGHKNAGKCLFC